MPMLSVATLSVCRYEQWRKRSLFILNYAGEIVGAAGCPREIAIGVQQRVARLRAKGDARNPNGSTVQTVVGFRSKSGVATTDNFPRELFVYSIVW